MNLPDISRDPPRDAELGTLLRTLNDPDEDRSLARLQHALRARAAMPLARLRSRPRWWDYAAEWARPAIPMAAAAGLLLAVVVGSLPTPTPMANDTGAGLPYMEEVLGSSMPDSDYYLVMAGGADSDALLRLAVEEQ
jgi:hypothetical protein